MISPLTGLFIHLTTKYTTQMSTKKQFTDRCEELGVTWEDNGYCLSIDAPEGMEFATYSTTTESVQYNAGRYKMSEAYAELLFVMKDGLIKE